LRDLAQAHERGRGADEVQRLLGEGEEGTERTKEEAHREEQGRHCTMAFLHKKQEEGEEGVNPVKEWKRHWTEEEHYRTAFHKRAEREEVEVMKELRHKKEEEAGVERMAMASERRY